MPTNGRAHQPSAKLFCKKIKAATNRRQNTRVMGEMGSAPLWPYGHNH